MAKSRDDLNILLLQIREDEETCLEEFYEFVEFGELSEQQVTSLNVFKEQHFSPEILDQYDALFVGGSSDASVLKPEIYPFIASSRRLLRYSYDKHIPVLASCFGFQVVVAELGGQVILDKENMEMGIYPITLSEQAKQDPLLFDMPNPFPAVSGHQERALTIPEDAVMLGYSAACPYHIIKFKNRPFYAFQFHPEVGRKDLITRITRYQTRYLQDQEALQAVIAKATEETTASNAIIKHFVDRIILG